MPTRLVREGILTSEAVNMLSQGAELFYRRLMSVADDYGRFYTNPTLLRSHCYPLQIDRFHNEQIEAWLADCVRVGVIIIYGEGKYLQIAKFGQQTRSKSKFPEPTENELLSKCKQMLSGRDNDRSAPTTTTHTTPTPNTDVKQNGHFKPPTREEVLLQCSKIGLPTTEADRFIGYYTSNGWKVGRNPMKSWQGALVNWRGNWQERKQTQRKPQKPDYLI